jgi:hypothetical protein
MVSQGGTNLYVDDIPDLGNLSIGNRNQTNPGVVRGIDSVQRILMQAEGI